MVGQVAPLQQVLLALQTLAVGEAEHLKMLQVRKMVRLVARVL